LLHHPNLALPVLTDPPLTAEGFHFTSSNKTLARMCIITSTTYACGCNAYKNDTLWDMVTWAKKLPGRKCGDLVNEASKGDGDCPACKEKKRKGAEMWTKLLPWKSATVPK